jgi:hypothetical protein
MGSPPLRTEEGFIQILNYWEIKVFASVTASESAF